MDRLKEIIKEYYDINDEGHGFDHAQMVADLAVDYGKYLIEKGNYNLDLRMLEIAGYCHDIFAGRREKHHELAHDEILNKSTVLHKELMRYFEDDMLRVNTIAKACLEHRASYKGEYFSMYSIIISSADRGIMDKNFIDNTIDRAIAFRSEKITKTHINSIVTEIRDHIVNKYAIQGYARIHDIMLEYHKDVVGIDINDIKWQLIKTDVWGRVYTKAIKYIKES